MAKTRVQEYVEKYSDQPIRFTPYALKKTGLVQSQVFLKIEDYLLICAPFQLSMTRGIFLVVLSAQEITFFQQFQKKLCSINLTFQKTGTKKPLNLFLRGTIERVGPVKGKQNVCMMDATIKACPNDLVEIIGDYITAFEGLKGQYQSFSGKAITVDEPAAKLMRFNNYVELLLGTVRARAQLVSLSVNSLALRLSAMPPGLAEGESCSARLYFQVYQFTANGKVGEVRRGDGEQVFVTVPIEFTPELIEIVDDYFFRQSIQGRARSAPAGN
ncbi:MAG TPA: PilZN3 domain-containing protein [Spirochaetia bacterium]